MYAYWAHCTSSHVEKKTLGFLLFFLGVENEGFLIVWGLFKTFGFKFWVQAVRRSLLGSRTYIIIFFKKHKTLYNSLGYASSIDKQPTSDCCIPRSNSSCSFFLFLFNFIFIKFNWILSFIQINTVVHRVIYKIELQL